MAVGLFSLPYKIDIYISNRAYIFDIKISLELFLNQTTIVCQTIVAFDITVPIRLLAFIKRMYSI